MKIHKQQHSKIPIRTLRPTNQFITYLSKWTIHSKLFLYLFVPLLYGPTHRSDSLSDYLDLWHFYEKYHINCVPFVYYNCTAPHRCGSSVGYLWTHQTTGEERAGASPTDAKWRKWQSSYLVISHCILAYLIISHQWWIIISYQISSYVVIYVFQVLS